MILMIELLLTAVYVADISCVLLYSSVDQLVDQQTVNLRVTGSSPVRGANGEMAESGLWRQS